ncbi:hypothetical protein UCRNP2_4587 [Neofusicoccum parvum UCRNP2]|uniref:Uncharacterized protein n=1 Tax=Botryosphaeria parva (strain UCR-NP2) TaxID=1287680 RepID=R1EM80_BOTPV|nr:hypothetical protein UCRNP2_4587 [Neofusicoccum parvum UCRNP2]
MLRPFLDKHFGPYHKHWEQYLNSHHTFIDASVEWLRLHDRYYLFRQLNFHREHRQHEQQFSIHNGHHLYRYFDSDDEHSYEWNDTYGLVVIGDCVCASLPDEGEPDAEDTTETKKRSIAGRIEYEVQETTSPNPSIVHGLAKRATDKTRIKKFGTCEIGGKEIKYPGWPGNNELQNKRNLITDQNPGGKIQQDQWWYRVKVGSCGEVSQLYHDPNFLPKPQVNEVNADHVFEKAIPRQFLDSLFTSNNPDQCSTFNGLFVDQTDANFPDDYKPKQGDPNTAKQIRLQSLFNRVPNNLNYNFVGLDKAVNGLKGTFFNPKLDGIEQPQAGGEGGQVDKNLNLWNRMGMVIDFLKMDVVQRVFVTGQSEVYAAFVRFDELWGSCQDPINFAENYRKYIQGLLSDNIASIQQHASKVSNSLVQYATTTDSDGNLNSYGKAM